MTLQDQLRKVTKWLNVNSIVLTAFTGCIIWFATMQVRIYNAILEQPLRDQAQDVRMDAMQKSLGEKAVDIEQKSRILTHEKQLSVINAIFPQTQINK